MGASEKSISIPLDFPDWLSPMVVKEIRQGLRGWVFISLFLVLHLCLLSWGCLTLAANRNEGRGGDHFFWFMLVVGMVAIVARGIFALQSERSENTLELLQISKLSAFRVVSGKWVALMMQVAVFLISLLPYGILRYYFGSFNAGIDGKIFLFVTVLASVFAALAVFLSCLKKWISWPALLLVGGALIAMMVNNGVRFDRTPWLFFIGITALALVYVPFFIYMGASSFATDSENLATPKRILGWLSLVPGIACLAIGGLRVESSFIVFLLGVPLVVLAMSDALIAPSTATPFAVRNFRRFKWVGSFAACFLAPNRMSGFLYTVTMGLIAGVIGYVLCRVWLPSFVELKRALGAIFALLSTAGLITYFSASLSLLVMRRRPYATAYLYWFCIGIQFAAGVILFYVVTEVIDQSFRPFWAKVALVSPVGVYAVMCDLYSFAKGYVLLKPAIFACVVQWLLVMGLYSVTLWRETKKLRRLLRNERPDERL
ncbi:MAG: hypothetical protein LBV12_11395 [Puniceicoccales bacterium]|jgi:hypothetical protein|nr:hypothetical protein [Puniceicoccales bacterium]